jgi:glycine/D-amino acid oxidase-like deaminating enzyme
MQLLPSLAALPESTAFDLVVVGAGGAGMAAALFAALAGQKVLLVERTEYVGGTTAWSGGTTWIPGTRHAASVNPQDTLADAKRYLDNAIGGRSPAALRQAFLDHGAQAVDLLENRSEVHYRAYPKHPDYISDLGGSTLNGRALEPLPFDGRLLGDLFALIRPPIPEFTVLGGMMVDRTDINHLLALSKSCRSFKHATKLLARHALDRLRHPRGTRLVMGNALVGRLLYSLSQHANVTLALNTSVRRIHREAQGITSVTLLQTGQHRTAWCWPAAALTATPSCAPTCCPACRPTAARLHPAIPARPMAWPSMWARTMGRAA